MDANKLAAHDFFISYAPPDRAWAEWIAWHLEAEGYTTFLYHRDVRPGSDRMLSTHRAAVGAKRTIAVLSSAYFPFQVTEAEWRMASQRDPSGEKGLFIPVLVEDIRMPGALRGRAYISLAGKDPASARSALLEGLSERGARPIHEPNFPGTMRELVSEEQRPHMATQANAIEDRASSRRGGNFRRLPSSMDSTDEEATMTSKAIPITKPRLFIGSSAEGLRIAEHLQLNLDYSVYCTIWSQGVFGLSRGTLETLVAKAKDFDYAALVLTPDDLVMKRGLVGNIARDNVLFELGLFMGTLGRERTFIVYCRDDPLDLPTDLAGVTPATFAQRPDGNLQAALGPVATQIKQEMGV